MGLFHSGPHKFRRAHESCDVGVRNRYILGRRIGRGCYGVVFEGERLQDDSGTPLDNRTGNEPPEPGEQCAIKKCLNCWRNPTDAQRMYREVSYLRAFRNHNNIIHLHEVLQGMDDKHLYLVMELMGTDLQKALRNAPLTQMHRACIAHQLLRGLKFVHSAAVIHRDIKPSNILLDARCKVRIADFGWARSDPCVGKDLSVMTDYAASRWYRSPEMLLGAQRYGCASDMWSAGCVISEMRLRKPLLGGSSTINMLERIVAMCGKPPQATIDALTALHSEYAKFMLESVPDDPASLPLERVFQLQGGATEQGRKETMEFIDFVSLFMQVHPEVRFSAHEALDHPWLMQFHNPGDEPYFGRRIVLPLGDTELHESAVYRDQVYSDVLGMPEARKHVEAMRRRRIREEAELRLQESELQRFTESVEVTQRTLLNDDVP